MWWHLKLIIKKVDYLIKALDQLAICLGKTKLNSYLIQYNPPSTSTHTLTHTHKKGKNADRQFTEKYRWLVA